MKLMGKGEERCKRERGIKTTRGSSELMEGSYTAMHLNREKWGREGKRERNRILTTGHILLAKISFGRR